MNEQFKEHATSSAFSLNLSKRMIGVLLHLDGSGPEDERLNLNPYLALQRRGLAYHVMNEGFYLTEEGKLVAQLVVMAGFNKE